MALTEIKTKSIKDGEVKSADIADSAVTLAKIENGTTSDNGKFLKNNDGAAPSWAEVDTSNITVADESTDTSCYPVFVKDPTGATAPKTGDNLLFDSNTGTLESTHLSTIASGGKITAYGVASLGGRTDAAFLDANGVTLSATSSGKCELRFQTASIAQFVGFKAPSTGDVIWQLPSADGTADQVLKTNGSATLSWADAGAGAKGNGPDKIFWENGKEITYNYTITDNHNAMTAGPVTIAATGNGDGSAVSVIVGDGETWTIV